MCNGVMIISPQNLASLTYCTIHSSVGFDLTDSQTLVGYIQVTGLKFYRDFCPAEKREQWFAQFKSKEDYKVYT